MSLATESTTMKSTIPRTPRAKRQVLLLLRGSTYWLSARGGCQSVTDTDLLILDNEEEAEYIRNRTAQINPDAKWWIGYYDVSIEGVWKWVDCTSSEPWHETLWAPGQPDNIGEQDCGIVGDNGHLYDELCDEYNYRYICEVTPKDFFGNDTNARNLKADALSSSEIEAIWEVSPNNCDVFGYRVHYYEIDNPDNTGSVSVFPGNATYAVISGLETDTEYAISVAGLTIDEELEKIGPVTVRTLLCPDGFERGPNDRCYYFSRGSTYWLSARGGCQSVTDTDLLILDNEEEAEYIRNRTAQIDPDAKWWIGYYDVSIEGVWKWVDCTSSEPWHETLWAPGQPDNIGEQDCGIVGDNGHLYDELCDEYNYRYICEVTPKDFFGNDTNARNLKADALSSSEIEAIWEVSPNNCDVFGYRVHYYEIDNPDNTGSVSVFPGNATYAVISGLETDTEYAISVAGLTIDEELEKIGPVTVRTLLCPDGFERGPNDRCYYFSRGSTYWLSARGGCQSVTDTDLLILDNEEEAEYIRNRTAQIDPDAKWWIGYYDVSIEGVWKWVDCTSSEPWHETLWAPGQPDNIGEQDCGIVGDNGHLYDELCDEYNYRYICEVTPKDFFGNDTNARNLKADALSSSEIEAIWEVSPNNCDVFGYRVHYYEIDNPDNTGSVSVFPGNATYAVISGLETDTEYAISVAGLTIDEELEKIGPVTVRTLLCPDGFERGPNDRCYYFSRGSTYWLSARGGCQSVTDTDLLILDNEEEAEYIRNRTAQIDPDAKWWIGYYDVSIEGVWKWVDCTSSEPWHETLWAPGQPDNNGEQDCGIVGDNGHLYDELCDEYNYRYICEVTPKDFLRNETNVRNVQGEALTPRSIQVTWDVSPYNCDIFGYRIHYYNIDEPGLEYSVSVFGGNVTNIVLTDLHFGAVYAISVAGLTTQEELERVGPVFVETPVDPCGVREITEDTVITSPGYPAPYPDYQHCEWYISFPENMYVLLRFEVFETENGYDIVTVGDGLEISPETAVLYLSGSKSSSEEIPEKYISGQSTAWMTFDSSVYPTSPQGFMIEVTIVDVGPSEPERIYYELSGAFGEFTSPGYPDNYEHNQDITWTISVAKPYVVSLTITQMNLEDNVDFIIIGSGTPDGNELETLTGTDDYYGPIKSLESQMWVRFMSDETINGLGFMASWHQVEGDEGNYCGTREIDLPSGTITSPGYPEPYPINQNCIWLISLPDSNAVVRLEFAVFQTEAGHDFLIVGEGNTVDENIMVSFSGSGSSPVTSPTNELWLRFYSDGSISAAGFRANFYSQGGSPPTTPPQNLDDSIVIIVVGETVGWFNVERQQTLAESIAEALNVFCETHEDNCGLEINIKALDIFRKDTAYSA
ncbi:uncharacterized protein [Amphiura filiformis]|uniref:uncharacterized protein n=1 Tax=Amphiura filiformis TaxID=82378 RepID=UPI003B211499